ncbi:DNA gyrase subunit B [Rahnella victoriana]|uniref:COG4648 family protein n=1 Tax=Rahnella victoriana TaxID=1510570 RepID=UPI000BC3D95A|nr:DNA gyrase subunit B [Rahnella victoriana]
MDKRRSLLLLKLKTIVRWAMPLAVIAYPIAVWCGLKNWGTGILAPLLITVFLLRLLTFRGKLSRLTFFGKAIAVTGIVLVAASVVLRETSLLLYYPVAVNGILLGLFLSSLYGRQSLVERLARLSEPDLPPEGVIYTRRVTQVWCVFFLCNGAFALYTCLKGDMALWALYNGGISYLLIGLLMGMEWIVRKRLRHL